MKQQELIDENIKKGDIVILYPWDYLYNKYTHELDGNNKENGNIILANGMRLFTSEKEMYGKPHIVTNIPIIGMYSNSTIDTYNKTEISPEEIMISIKSYDACYNKWLDKILANDIN